MGLGKLTLSRPESLSVLVAVGLEAARLAGLGVDVGGRAVDVGVAGRARQAQRRRRRAGRVDHDVRARIRGGVSDVVGDDVLVAIAMARRDAAGRVVRVGGARIVGADLGVASVATAAAGRDSVGRRQQRRSTQQLGSGRCQPGSRVGALRQRDAEGRGRRVATAGAAEPRGVDGSAARTGRVVGEVECGRGEVGGDIPARHGLARRARRARAPAERRRDVGATCGRRHE